MCKVITGGSKLHRKENTQKILIIFILHALAGSVNILINVCGCCGMSNLLKPMTVQLTLQPLLCWQMQQIVHVHVLQQDLRLIVKLYNTDTQLNNEIQNTILKNTQIRKRLMSSIMKVDIDCTAECPTANIKMTASSANTPLNNNIKCK